MTDNEVAAQAFERLLKLSQKEDVIAMQEEVRKLIVYAVKCQYVDYQMKVLICVDDMNEGQMKLFLRAIEQAQANNWRKKLMTHSKIMRQWLRLNNVVTYW
ncbi:hypothetical protein [Kurthia senegalensis]|uniref:hypothetical protein n=1 Tax=Kurthia senegalensis TaxID=1033740 RepID=UPI000287B5E5|nr:hypothetical protein [Kurthia senegalensis]